MSLSLSLSLHLLFPLSLSMLLWISFRRGMKTLFTGRIILTLRRIPILKPGYDLDLTSRSIPLPPFSLPGLVLLSLHSFFYVLLYFMKGKKNTKTDFSCSFPSSYSTGWLSWACTAHCDFIQIVNKNGLFLHSTMNNFRGLKCMCGLSFDPELLQ